MKASPKESASPTDLAEVAANRPDDFPVSNPLESLTPASRRIVNAAARLLSTEGVRSVTMERVAKEAGVNKWTIRNNFGSMSALLGAAVDSFLHDECVRITRDLKGLPREERLGHIAPALRRMVMENEATGYFKVLPLALEEGDLHSRFLALYEWWYEEIIRWLGDGEDAPDADQMRVQRGMARLMAALIDGLWLQATLHHHDPDLEAAFEALEILLERGLKGTISE